jgi:hypothetical protein
MRMGVQVLGVEGTGARMAGQSRAGMLFFVDIGSGKLLFVVWPKTMRGFKSRDKALAHRHLLQHLRGENGVSDLRKVV